MANIRVPQALERISNELDRVGRYVVQYGGIRPQDARYVQNLCSDLIQMSGRILEEAEVAERKGGGGVAPHVGKRGLVKKLRKALGYTYP